MTNEFDRDLADIRTKLDAARIELFAVVTALREDDLDRERRGGWTVRRVLEHVIESEWLYGRLVLHLRGMPVPGDPIEALPSSPGDAAARLGASRAALLAATEGVDEDTFYRLQKVGHEEYSVISMLENEASHEREHAGQVQGILGK